MPESIRITRRNLLRAASAAGLMAPAMAAEMRILVYTRNYTPDGKGYVHDNIAASVEAITKMGRLQGFAVDATSQPAAFTADNLQRYRAIVFANSNHEAFENEAQRHRLQDFVWAGGGVAGIHSATGSERQWPWFWAMLGGKFARHPKMQTFTVRVKDPSHPAARGLPASFEWTDECYYHTHINPAIQPILVTDPAQLDDPKKDEYPGGRFGSELPLAWQHRFDGGRVFYTALGHKKEHYQDPRLTAHILGGIQWAMGAI